MAGSLCEGPTTSATSPVVPPESGMVGIALSLTEPRTSTGTRAPDIFLETVTAGETFD